MSIVTLLSGGLDSCLMSVLTAETGRVQIPLFVDYGQINKDKELAGAINHCSKFGLPEPVVLDVSGFGAVIRSGLTDSSKDIVSDAFLPGRNMLLLLLASSFAVQNNCTAVALGLLDERTVLFPDQTDDFLMSAEYSISKAMGERIDIVAPLRGFSKQDVISLAKDKGVTDSYSCHAGGDEPCGQCISCREFEK